MSTASFIVTPICEAVRAHLPMLTNMFSPSSNSCIVKTTPLKGAKRFRYDPYKAAVLNNTASPSSTTVESQRAQFVPYTTEPQQQQQFVQQQYAQPQQQQQASMAPQSSSSFYMHPHAAVPPMMMYSYYPVSTSPMPSVVVGPTASSSVDGAVSAPPSAPLTRVPSPAPLALDEPAAASSAVAPIDAAADDAKPVSSDKTVYAVVQFRYDSCTYIAPFPVSVGDRVIVEGDRGVNMGTVSKLSNENPTDRTVISKVMRRATTHDVSTHDRLREKEAAVTQFSQTAVKDLAMTNVMRVVDAEYQTDMNKVTIFFRADKLVDFRKLQRVLFKEFRCRLWLVNLTELEQGGWKKTK